MWRLAIGLAAAIVILTNGVVEGLWNNRWHRSVELEASIERLSRIPTTIGDWVSTESEVLDDSVRNRGGVDGYIYRHYDNPLNSKRITVLLMCGRSGPLSVHTPDICYRGAGFRLDGSIEKWPQKLAVGSSVADCHRAKFSKDDATDGSSIRIAWSWTGDGQWQTPSSPRVAFARLPVLYKLYVVHQETPASQKGDEELCRGFVEQLLPAVNASLFDAK